MCSTAFTTVTQRLTLVFTPSTTGNTGNLHPPAPSTSFPSAELLGYSKAELSRALAVDCNAQIPVEREHPVASVSTNAYRQVHARVHQMSTHKHERRLTHVYSGLPHPSVTA